MWKMNIDESHKEHLFNAINESNLQALQKIDFSSLDINIKNENGSTPLTLCLMQYTPKSLGILRYLLEEKANPNHLDGNGNLPLHLAVENMHYSPYPVQHCTLLLEAGANPNNMDGRKRTALDILNKEVRYSNNQRQVFQILLETGANVLNGVVFDAIELTLYLLNHKIELPLAFLRKRLLRLYKERPIQRQAIPPQECTNVEALMKSMYQQKSGIVFGETHQTGATAGFVVEHLELLASCGVKILFLEGVIPGQEEQWLKILSRSLNFTELFSKAKELNIQLKGIDCAKQYLGIYDVNRCIFMNLFAAEQIKNKSSSEKWVAITGLGHTNTVQYINPENFETHVIPGVAELLGTWSIYPEHIVENLSSSIFYNIEIPCDKKLTTPQIFKPDIHLRLPIKGAMSIEDTIRRLEIKNTSNEEWREENEPHENIHEELERLGGKVIYYERNYDDFHFDMDSATIIAVKFPLDMQEIHFNELNKQLNAIKDKVDFTEEPNSLSIKTMQDDKKIIIKVKFQWRERFAEELMSIKYINERAEIRSHSLQDSPNNDNQTLGTVNNSV